MPFSNRFGLNIIVNNQPVKELANGEVHLPFNTEYAVRIRNRHKNLYAVAKLFIDNEEQSKGGFIIEPNSFRDIRNSSFSTNVFKFVDLCDVEALRAGKDSSNKNKAMGVVEARFHLQKQQPQIQYVPVPVSHSVRYVPMIPHPRPWFTPRATHFNAFGTHMNDCLRGGLAPAPDFNSSQEAESVMCNLGPSVESAISAASPGVTMNMPTVGSASLKSVPDGSEVRDGATVAGSNTGVTYGTQWVDIEDDYVSLKFFLRGYHIGEKAEAAAKQVVGVCHCDQCGAKAARASSKFCHICGSNLLC